MNTQVDYLAVYRASRTAILDEYFSRCHVDDSLPSDEDFARAELTAAREYVGAKRSRKEAKRLARNAERCA